ncbi:DUF1772-domain-containing protein [Phlyctochytrium arcticum]|nr:DUF1772-domain-containing protein [Phlyctochytrium arcticum]
MVHLDDPRVVNALVSTAVTSAGLFTGAALYVSAVEHPSRYASTAEASRRQFQHSYPRAARLQAALATIATGSSLALGLATKAHRFYVAAAAFAFIPAYTFAVIMPVNKRLLTTTDALTGETTWTLFRNWNVMHWVRVAAATIGFGALVWPARYIS